MRLHHKTPCAECPWRRESPAGWLGGHTPEMYADAVAMGQVPACHLRDHGPELPATAFCVGALSTMANQCLMPHHQEGAAEARQIVGRRSETFSHVGEFYQHHAGVRYVHPLVRRELA